MISTIVTPTYFIAEIGSNFDGDFHRALALIELAQKCGAQAVKFQNYTAESLVSDVGFQLQSVSSLATHQSSWSQSVALTYKKAELPLSWLPDLASFARKIGLDFITSPYSIPLLEEVAPFCDSIKIGSGDITYHSLIKKAFSYNKPVLVGTGASTLNDVLLLRSLDIDLTLLTLLQCTTSYTGDLDDDRYQNISVLKQYRSCFPSSRLGLSCHHPTPIGVLAAVVLGATVIEKHFTDDKTRPGPDHSFALDPRDWISMVQQVRSLERALGDGQKRVEANEISTNIVQRRAAYVKADLSAGTPITLDQVEFLRPCPPSGIPPYLVDRLVGRILKRNLQKSQLLTLPDLL